MSWLTCTQGQILSSCCVNLFASVGVATGVILGIVPIRLFTEQKLIWLLVLKIVHREIAGMLVIQRGHTNTRPCFQRERELCTGWQCFPADRAWFGVWRTQLALGQGLLQVLEREEGGTGGGKKLFLVAALTENSKPFRPFLVMVENVKIDCIRDLPVTLNSSTLLLLLPSFLPRQLGWVL